MFFFPFGINVTLWIYILATPISVIPLVHMIFVVSYNSVTVKLIIIVFFLIKVFEVREVYKLTGELQISVSAKISKVNCRFAYKQAYLLSLHNRICFSFKYNFKFSGGV